MGRPIEQVGAHAKGYNHNSIGICLVGGVDEEDNPENNFTLEQFSALFDELTALKRQFPWAEIIGHRDLPEVAKSCVINACANTVS